jgi:flavodoxin-like protein
MSILVVYESMFGNTMKVAEAIAEALRVTGDVRFGSVDEIKPEDARDAALIVAGAPTQAFGLPRAEGRDAARKAARKHDYPPVLAGGTTLRSWLDELPEGSATVAAFDTRFNKPAWMTGSAAKKIARRLEGKGYTVAATESFFVTTSGGPLAPGEIERASAWARSLAEASVPVAP